MCLRDTSSQPMGTRVKWVCKVWRVKRKDKEWLIHYKLKDKEEDVTAAPVDPLVNPTRNFSYLLSLARPRLRLKSRASNEIIPTPKYTIARSPVVVHCHFMPHDNLRVWASWMTWRIFSIFVLKKAQKGRQQERQRVKWRKPSTEETRSASELHNQRVGLIPPKKIVI